MKALFTGILFCIVAAVSSSETTVLAQGSCDSVRGPERAWSETKNEYIFAGKVIAYKSKKYPEVYKVLVTESFRGLKQGDLVDVQKEGGNYLRKLGLVYAFVAYRNEGSNKLREWVCSYTYNNFDLQKEFIEYFRLISAHNLDGSFIIGKAFQYLDPDGNSKKPDDIERVFLTDNLGRESSVRLDPDGFYKFTGLPEGEYRVFLKLPKTLIAFVGGYFRQSSFRNVTLSKKKGTVVRFSVAVNGIIRGKLIAEDDTPVPYLQVNIYLLDNKGKEHLVNYTESDFEGDYEFRGMGPGEYIIRTGSDDKYFNDNKIEPQFHITFFPGSTIRSNAEIIELGKFQVQSRKNIRLIRLKKLQIEGQVLMPDGNPAKYAGITYQFKRKDGDINLISFPYRSRFSDHNGRFSLNGFEGADYILTAHISEKISESRINILFSGCSVVRADDDKNNIVIQLRKSDSLCDVRAYGFK